MEEVGRMIGYDSITPAGAAGRLRRCRRTTRSAQFHHAVRDMFVDAGLHRGLQLLLRERGAGARLRLRPGGARARGQPHRLRPGTDADVAPARASGRTSLENSKHCDTFRLFEIGREIHKRREGLPDEIPHLAAAVYERQRRRRGRPVRDQAPGRVPACPARKSRPAAARSYEHPARAAELVWRGETVGRLFELHPSLVEGAPRCSISICARCTGLSGGEEKLHAHPPLSLERVRSLGDRGTAGAGGRPRDEAERASPGRCSNRSSTCGSTPARRCRRTEERLLPPDRGLAGAHALLRRSRRDPRPHHRRHARPGLRSAGVSTRRTTPGGWVDRRGAQALPLVRRRGS